MPPVKTFLTLQSLLEPVALQRVLNWRCEIVSIWNVTRQALTGCEGFGEWYLYTVFSLFSAECRLPMMVFMSWTIC